jgi:hypothetical protein
MKKLLGVILLFSILSLSGVSAFADGVGITEAPTRTGCAQTTTATLPTGTDATTDILFTTIVSLMTTLPL